MKSSRAEKLSRALDHVGSDLCGTKQERNYNLQLLVISYRETRAILLGGKLFSGKEFSMGYVSAIEIIYLVSMVTR